MRSRLLCLGLFFCLVGCGENVVNVSGKVTLDDKPLANATVMFHPLSDQKNPGPGSTGKTDEKGEYTLSLNTKDLKGALPGKHKVSIVAAKGEAPKDNTDSKKVQEQLVPEKYNTKTELTFEVPATGTTSADFKLTSK